MKQFDDIDANRIIYKDFNSPEELNAVLELTGFKIYSKNRDAMTWIKDYCSNRLMVECWLDQDETGRKYKNFKITITPNKSRLWVGSLFCFLKELTIVHFYDDNLYAFRLRDKNALYPALICIDMNIKKEEEGCDAI